MAKITRSSIVNNSIDLLGIQTSVETPPTTASNIIAPVIEVGPKFSNIARFNVTTATGNQIIYTTPTDKDFYLTFAEISITKSAASDCIATYFQVVIGGANIRFLYQGMETLTKETLSRSMSLNYPIKLDRGSAITLVGAFTAGALTRASTFCGFILE